MRNNNNTKEKFIETASKLFQIKGYNATGLNEILKESNAPKGSLYYHFPNGKEQLALEAIRMSGEKIKNNLSKILDTYEDPIEGIIYNINNMAKIIDLKNKMEGMSISLLALEIYSTSDTLRNMCKEVFLGIEDIYIKKLVASGLKEEDAKKIAIIISSMTEGAITLSLTIGNGDSLRKVAEVVPVLINGFKK